MTLDNPGYGDAPESPRYVNLDDAVEAVKSIARQYQYGNDSRDTVLRNDVIDALENLYVCAECGRRRDAR